LDLRYDYRILEVSSSGGLKGAEQHQLELFKRLKKHGIWFQVAVSGQKRGFWDVLHQRRIPYVKFHLRGKLDIKTVFALYHFIKKNNISLVHTHLSTASILGGLAGRLARIPVVSTVHNVTNKYAKYNYIFSDYLIAVSSRNKEMLISQGVKPNRIIDVILNGINLEKFEKLPQKKEARRHLNIPQDRFVIGNVGTFSERKNLKVLLNAFVKIKKEIPEAFCMLAGGGHYKGELVDFANRLGIEKDVKFIDFCEDVLLLYASLDVFVLSSKAESGPLVVLEAMASNLPVIVTDVGAVREYLGEQGKDLIVPINNADAIAKKCIYLYSRRGYYQYISNYNKERVKMFDVEEMVKKTITVFDRLIKSESAVKPKVLVK